MNRFTIAIILILLLALIGSSIYWAQKFKHLKQDEFDAIKMEIQCIKKDHQEAISRDSIDSIVEQRVLESQDSIVNVFDEQYRKLKNYYRYELQKRDERIASRLDSLNSIKPNLPDF